MQFQIHTNTGRQYYWRLLANNHLVIAVSGEYYVRKVDCEHGITLVKSLTSLTQFQFYQDQRFEWRWRVVATNGQIIAISSEGYTQKHHCEHAASLVLQAKFAPVSDLAA